MSVQYYRYKATHEAPWLPDWRTTWPGQSGCSSYGPVYHTATRPTQPPSPGYPLSYSPETVVYTYSSPKTNGIRSGGAPPYRFTNYSVGRITRKEYLVVTHHACNGLNRFYQYGIVAKSGGSCIPTPVQVTEEGPCYSTYDEQTREFSPYSVYTRSELNEGEIQSQSDDLRNELIADAASSYDVLTDIAQISDIPRSIAQIAGDLTKIFSGLRGRFGKNLFWRASSYSPLELLKHPEKMMRILGNEWMNYRYGIMPLVYSFRDMVKTANRGQEVRTRKSRHIYASQTGQVLPPSSVTYLIRDVSGSVTVRGEVFQFFESDEIARLSGLGLNPLVTAWELIPYSFVADWFIDVGSYIAAATCSTWAQKKWSCLSRRQNYSRQTWVHLPNRDETVSITDLYPASWWGSHYPPTPSLVISNPEGEYLLEEEVYDTYSRTVIPTEAALPSFRPSLNWRRLVDGSVMTLNQLGRLFKRP